MRAAKGTTFVLVHGAWLGTWSWSALAKQLENHGHRAIAVPQPAHDLAAAPGDVTLEDYAESTVSILDAQVEPVVLVGHSFGGITISRAAEMRPEKVRHLVYLAAFLLPNDVSFNDAAAAAEGSEALENLEFSQDGSTVTIRSDAAHQAVAHDVPVEAFAAAAQLMVPEPVRPLGDKLVVTDATWGAVPRYYIHTTADRALPLPAQKSMVARLPVKGTRSLDTSHVPFISAPDKLADCLQELGF